jgi:hypothetical protein
MTSGQGAEKRLNEVMMWRRNEVKIGRELCERPGRTRGYLPLSSQLQKHSKYTGNYNEVKRIIIPNGYSNETGFDVVESKWGGTRSESSRSINALTGEAEFR